MRKSTARPEKAIETSLSATERSKIAIESFRMKSENGSKALSTHADAPESSSELNSQDNDEIMEDVMHNAEITEVFEPATEIQAEKGLNTKLECLKAIVECIRGNINRNAVVLQRAIAFNGASTSEKLRNLAKEALNSFKESQELPSKAVKKILAANEDGLQGKELIKSLKIVAALDASEKIEINRRLGSLNKIEAEKNADTLSSIVKPKVLALL